MSPEMKAAYETEERVEALAFLGRLPQMNRDELLAACSRYLGYVPKYPEHTDDDDLIDVLADHFEACIAETLRPSEMAVAS